MTSLMVTFRTFSFLDFLADLLQKSISVASNLFACCVFSVHVSAPNYCRAIAGELIKLDFHTTCLLAQDSPLQI
jgi:hypothetical protein